MITFSNRPKSTSTGGDVDTNEILKVLTDATTLSNVKCQFSERTAVGTNGALYIAGNTRVCTTIMRLDPESKSTYSIEAPLKVRACYYRRATISQNAFIEMDDWVTAADGTALVNSNHPYVMFVFANANDTSSAITAADVEAKFSYDFKTRKTKPMDGLHVGIIGDSISSKSSTDAIELEITAEDIGAYPGAVVTKGDVDAGITIGPRTLTSEDIGTYVTFNPTTADIGKKIGRSEHYTANNNLKLWWEYAADALGFKAISSSWSGASITSHESSSDAKKGSHAYANGIIRKCGERIPGTANQHVAPDVIIIFRGANDYSHAPYAELTDGYFDTGSSFEYPETDVISEGHYGFKEAYVKTIKNIRTMFPTTYIILCTLPVNLRLNSDGAFPADNGTNSIQDFNKAIREVADYMGCGLINFDKSGITYENIYNAGLAVDSSTTPTHPSGLGHMVLGQQAISDLSKIFV